MSTKLSDQELQALLNRQSPDFAAAVDQTFRDLVEGAQKAGRDATLQEVVTVVAAQVRAMSAALANEIVAQQIAKSKGG